MKQGFKPESINDIKVGMKILLRYMELEFRGTVMYVGPVSRRRSQLGVELDPGEGEY